MNPKVYDILKKSRFKRAILSVYLPYANLKNTFIARLLNDEKYIKYKFKRALGYIPDLEHPKTFQEKLQWIKLNDHKFIYHQMVDKVDAKQFIAERVGSEFVIPTLGVYDSFDEIDFDKLPNSFILKGTFDSGSYYLCRDKSQLDTKLARKRVTQNWNNDYYIWSREWPYKGLKHRIIAEPLLTDGGDFLVDCKFFCFNGEPRIVYYSHDIAKDAKTDFFDMDWNHMPIKMRDSNSNERIEKPMLFEKMKKISKILASNTYHLRVDFYLVKDAIYVGEMTFFHCGGFQKIYPSDYNMIFGDWIKLPID